LGDNSPEEVKWQITKIERARQATEMVNGGMSRRQAAKVLGVDPRTVRRDLGQSAPGNGAESPTSKPAKTRTAHEEIVPMTLFLAEDPPYPEGRGPAGPAARGGGETGGYGVVGGYSSSEPCVTLDDGTYHKLVDFIPKIDAF
jgi:hypothetical protein